MSQDKIDDRGRSDSLDLYNEELARKAVGSLFDDEAEDEVDADDSRYVTGFDRPGPTRKSRVREGAGAGARESVRDGARESIRESGHDDASDSTRDSFGEGYASYESDDYAREDEEGSGYSYRKRDRAKEATPAPRPAVKVNVSSAPPRSAHGARSTRTVRPVTSIEETENIEDEYDSFRPREKKRIIESATRSEMPTRSRNSRADIGRGDTGRERAYSAYDNEPTSLVRWVAAALTFVFLIILAFLVYRISVISGELAEARAIIEATPVNDAEITEMRLEIEKLEAQLMEKDTEIAQLRDGILSSQPTEDQPPAWQGNSTSDEPDTATAEQPPATNEPALPTVYTVVKGDNLTKICNMFYGSASLANIQKVKDANNLTSDNISVGQKLTIPE